MELVRILVVEDEGVTAMDIQGPTAKSGLRRPGPCL